jgi:hypothetical protein
MLELIKGYETAVISSTFALVGVLLTLVMGLISKWMDKRQALTLKKNGLFHEF